MLPHIVFQHGTKDLTTYLVQSMASPDFAFDMTQTITLQCTCGKRYSGPAERAFLDLEEHLMQADQSTHQVLNSLGSRIHLVEQGCRCEEANPPVCPEFECVVENEDNQCCC